MKKLIQNSSLNLALLGLASMTAMAQKNEAKLVKPNILFIAVDDLKPLITAYGDKDAITPGMDRLANEGMAFQNCYVQQAISGATRASCLTGMRPDKTKVWDLVTNFRQVNPNAVSMPEYFLKNGYETAAVGKIYHMGSVGPGHDAPSWSLPYVNDKAPTYVNFTPEKGKKGPAIECADVPDNTYQDGVCAEEGIKLMQQLKQKGKPFFLAVGFHKPHLPFVAPKKYWDLYKRDQFKIAPFQHKAAGSPDMAYHVSGELKSYTDIPQFDSYSEKELDHLSVDKQKELIHGYYAATSYMDAQLVKVLNELDRLGLAENTIVVLWGDHGWHLGDHGLWNKHTDFEQATHACFLMRVKGMAQNMKPTTQCEFVDIFPTLCDLTGIPTPKYLDGISLVPAMKNPTVELREYAFSQYPRKDAMGYTIRTKTMRYTEWIGDYYSAEKPYCEAKILASEMYDYSKDPLETKSVIGDKAYKNEEAMMKKLFKEAMVREHTQYVGYAKLANFQKPISTTPEKKGRKSGDIE
ncbi:MAG: sulfatase [Paludibacter sp.]